MRCLAAEWEHRAPGTVPVESASLRPDPEERERAQGEGIDRLPPGKLPGVVSHHREQQLHARIAPSHAAALAAGALHRGRARERQASWSSGQVQDP